MGFRYRKSMRLGPVRVTASKSGIGYSVGGRGVRVTKRADGRVQKTVGLPGTGLSYTSTDGTARQRRGRTATGAARGAPPSARSEATRRAIQAVPAPKHLKSQRILLLVGLALTIVGCVVLPLLVLALPCVLVALIMSLVNLKRDLRWAHERKAAIYAALAEATARPIEITDSRPR